MKPDKKQVTPLELMQQGGAWLGAVHSWIQTRVWNGEHATWGNQTEPIALKRPVVAELEELAAIVAAAAINEYESKRAQGHFHQFTEDARKMVKQVWLSQIGGTISERFTRALTTAYKEGLAIRNRHD